MSRVRATGHQVIPGALGRGTSKDRGFDIEKALGVEKRPHGGGDLRPQHQALLHLLAPQVHIAKLQPHFLTHGRVFVHLEGRSRRGVEDFQFLAKHFNLTGGHGGIDRTLAPGSHPSGDPQYIFRANPIRSLEMFVGIRVENDLDDTFAIPQIEEYHATMVPAAIDPAAQRYGLADM